MTVADDCRRLYEEPIRRQIGRSRRLAETPFTVRLPVEMYDTLCQRASREETTASALVRRAIRRLLVAPPRNTA